MTLGDKIRSGWEEDPGGIDTEEVKSHLQQFKEAIAANVSEKRKVIELGKILHIMKEVFGEELTQSKYKV